MSHSAHPAHITAAVSVRMVGTIRIELSLRPGGSGASSVSDIIGVVAASAGPSRISSQEISGRCCLPISTSSGIRSRSLRYLTNSLALFLVPWPGRVS